MALSRRLRFSDLVELNIVPNRVTLGVWIRDKGFPPGKLLGGNSRSWAEDEVQAWIDSSPSEPKMIAPNEGRIGRPRKKQKDQVEADTA